jgi:hypothetical protein
METVFAPAEQVAVPVVGTTSGFPVRRVYCVGQNYSAHVREMGGDPSKTQPVFFSKPPDALVIGNSSVSYPMATVSLHFVFLATGLVLTSLVEICRRNAKLKGSRGISQKASTNQHQFQLSNHWLSAAMWTELGFGCR